MKFNLRDINNAQAESQNIDPRDIFKLLHKKDRKYSYLRDVQSEVLQEWFSRRDEPEIVIKMNTGSGKTVVSLLILQSYLNMGDGPAVYVVPDNYLLSQVQNEANLLGVRTTTEPRDINYIKQKSILIINIHKLFNGHSVFGVGDEGIKIDIGVLLIDDAHACIDKLEEQFSISITTENSKYSEILSLFEEDLEQQSISKTADLKVETPGTMMQVPFWSIQKKYRQILQILSADHEVEINSELKWKFPLLKHYIQHCDCVITNRLIEFSMRVTPVEVIGSYQKAKKLITSATLPDDTILHRYLSISKDAIEKSITPDSASDLGERLIIVPEEINPEFKKTDIKQLIQEYSRTFKTVVIVPSYFHSIFWEDIADKVLYAETIIEGLEDFRKKDSGLIVLINKYDGIDLPDDDCRLLIIDELPEDRSEIEKMDSTILSSFNQSLLRKIRKIEQGMGRAIRSNEDYSAVILLGRSLTNYLFAKNGFNNFTPATRKQIDVSSKLIEQIHGGSLEDLKDAINLILERDDEWLNTIKSSLIGLKFTPQIPNDIAFSFRKSYEKAWIEQYNESVTELEKCANNNRDSIINGWLKYYVAMFQNHLDESSAQMILKSGITKNSKIVRPLAGIQYQKISHATDQAEKCKEFLNQYREVPNRVIIAINSLLEDLKFLPETSEAFEKSIKDIGTAIGFISQRPEKETGRGPDNLWCCGNLNYFIIECKNGCTAELINKHDTNQLNGSIIWFGNEYDEACEYTPIMIHPRLSFEHAASPNKKIRIMDEEKLNDFKSVIRSFFIALIKSGQIPELDQIRILLRDYKLLPKNLISEFTKSI